jgi:hypothetical protein
MFAQSASAEVAFEELRPQHAAAFGNDHLAGQQTGNHFHLVAIRYAGPDHPSVKHFVRIVGKEVLVANKRHVAAALPMDCIFGRDDGSVFVTEHNPSGTKTFVPQIAVGI